MHSAKFKITQKREKLKVTHTKSKFYINLTTFHKYSQKAIDLFPAQPYAYLTKGKSLQIQKKDQDAIDILESGIDFVIDNPSLESEFYETMAKAYDGLGNAAKAQEYRTKAKKVKKNKQ